MLLFDGMSPFLGAAVIGSAILITQSLLAFFAGGHDGDGGMDDAGGDHPPDDLFHDIAGHMGSLLSLRNLGAFLFGFGWAGQLWADSPWRMVLALFWGILFVAGVVALMKCLARLRQENRVDLWTTVMQETTVYIDIPEHGYGRVLAVPSTDASQEFDAFSESGEAIPHGTRVVIVDVRGDALVVRRLD